ncbi:MAG TPA: ferritin-like domain-containing protein [Desulfobacterales bacterium]|nr:ferritin-like domain-containing protein [Desulfobacterales bacterium]
MDKQNLIEMLNRDIADEHAAIIRYLIHGYLEGEDTALGSKLLSRSREEMWHMHWLGMIIGKLGGEPDMVPAPYPYDPSNRASIFESYVKYEKNLIGHYNSEADKVEDPHIKRVLQREGWESDIHARKFQRILDKLTPKEAAGLPGAESELPAEFIDRIQKLVENKYNQMLHHLRNAWVFQREGMTAWQLMDFSMTKMKQLAHLAEPVAENGITPNFTIGGIKKSTSIGDALKDAAENVRASRERHLKLRQDSETQKHAGMIINLDLTLKQERYEEEEIGEW